MQRWWFDSGHRKFGKGKNMLIKHDIPRYVDSICWNMETFVAFVESTIPKEDALFRAKIKLATVIGPKVRPVSTAKNLEKGIIRLFIKENLNGSLHV